MELETLVGVFRCLLPRRYWHEMGRGAYASVMLTAAAGVRVGYAGFFAYASRAGEEAATLALKVGGGGGAPGMSPESQAGAALMGMALTPFAYFLFTPTGWVADYLVLSALFRAVTLSVGNPWGDPVLTVIDTLVRSKVEEDRRDEAARKREEAEGPAVPDEIVAGTQFAGKPADFVIVSSRLKEGWTKNTTVVASGVRLRLGDPVERTVKGRLRTLYPLSVIQDIQVDRRVVLYDWPSNAPPLPTPDDDPWGHAEDPAGDAKPGSEREVEETPDPAPRAAEAGTAAERRRRMD